MAICAALPQIRGDLRDRVVRGGVGSRKMSEVSRLLRMLHLIRCGPWSQGRKRHHADVIPQLRFLSASPC